MSRETKKDSVKLFNFVKKYSVKALLKNKDFKTRLFQMHKVYYALLSLFNELQYQKPIPINTKDPEFEIKMNNFNLYMNEFVSECGGIIFLWINGCYKISEQSLRSSIENFMKSVGCLTNSKILFEKNTYKVIELFSKIPLFAKGINKDMYDTLLNEYSELCSYVHTSKIQHMQQINSLGNFPHFSEQSAGRIAKRYLKIIQLFITLLCLQLPDYFQKIHYKNKDIILESLPKKYRSRIMEAIS